MAIPQNTLSVKTTNPEDQAFIDKLNALNFGAVVFKANGFLRNHSAQPLIEIKLEKKH
jgi:hypothetical protein